MRATIHVDDIGPLAAVRRTAGRPVPRGTPGLLESRALTAAPLRGTRLPRPQLGRVGSIAFWDSDAAIDAHRALHEPERGGWSARLEAIRTIPVAGGHFPGVPDGVGTVDVDGNRPVVVVTIARTRLARFPAFSRTNRHAEVSLGAAPGLLWATGFANVGQRVVATLSLWESGDAAHRYAVGADGHRAAMRAEGSRSFHHVGSFVRFRAAQIGGELGGRNPLPAAISRRFDAGS